MFPLRPSSAPTRKKKKQPLLFTATCGAGLEPLVAEEITGSAAPAAVMSWPMAGARMR